MKTVNGRASLRYACVDCGLSAYKEDRFRETDCGS